MRTYLFACVLATSLFVSDLLARETYELQVMKPESASCRDAVQGQIAWDYKGNTKWSQANIDRLCRGAKGDEPAQCFKLVMHGGVPWNSSGNTQWTWQNAIDLCEGSANADSTVNCFRGQIKEGRTWQDATAACDERDTDASMDPLPKVITGFHPPSTEASMDPLPDDSVGSGSPPPVNPPFDLPSPDDSVGTVEIPSAPGSGWKKLGPQDPTNKVVGMAASGGNLYAALNDNSLVVRLKFHLTAGEFPRNKIGTAYNVVGMAASEGRLYAALSDNTLWVRKAGIAKAEWRKIDTIKKIVGVVGMAASEGQLYAALSDNTLWVRKAVPAKAKWRKIDTAYGVVGLAASGGTLYAVTNNRLWFKPFNASMDPLP